MTEAASILNRNERRVLIKQLRGQPREKQWSYVQRLACDKVYPLTEQEMELSDEILSLLPNARWFHGGRFGRTKGDILLPASDEVNRARGTNSVVSNSFRAVYFTTEHDIAFRYATAVQDGNGAVYEVQPLGRIEADSNDLRAVTMLSELRPIRQQDGSLCPWVAGMAFCSPEAKVLEVY